MARSTPQGEGVQRFSSGHPSANQPVAFAGASLSRRDCRCSRRGAARLVALDVSPDDLTHAYAFGREAMMPWGAPREVELAPGAVAYSATGARLQGPIALDEDEPLIVLSGHRLDLGRTVDLGETEVVGDTFLQFDVTNARDGSERFEGPWSWHERRAGDDRTRELVTAEGGERPGDI